MFTKDNIFCEVLSRDFSTYFVKNDKLVSICDADGIRSERTVYAVSNSWMETKQAVLPLSAPVSTSILLCFGNRHNHITVFDETIFVSSMTLYQQAVQTYIHLLILRCKTLVGECPSPFNLHFPMQAAHPFGTLFTRWCALGRSKLAWGEKRLLQENRTSSVQEQANPEA